MKQALFSAIAIAAFVPIFGFVTHVGPSFEIEDGNCSTAIMGDMVYMHYVDRIAIPLVQRSDVVEHHGDEKIYCVLVKSDQHEHRFSTAEVTKGGVNHTYIEVSLQSDAGYGYSYLVLVFGKKGKHSKSIFSL